MQKVLIATFSQAGSTTKIAESLAQGFSSSEWEITYLNIAQDKLPNIEDFDVVGIGTPTYFFQPPFLVKEFVRNLNGLTNKSTFVFVLYGTHPGKCGNWMRRELKKKGSKDLGYFKSTGADYWHGYIKRGVMFSPDAPTTAELSAAEVFGKKLAVRFKDKEFGTDPFDGTTPLMYQIERMAVAQPFVKAIYTKAFRADENCVNCGICIKKCPTNNITERDDKKLIWGADCLFCASCELSCPENAIHSAFNWSVFTPFMNYNISKSKNIGIPFKAVKHNRGKTRLI